MNFTTDNVHFSVGEEDVNWATNTFAKVKSQLLENKLMQYLPFIALGIVSIVIMIIFIYFFKKFDVLVAMADKLDHAATVLAQASSGTTVITP
jgi:hypothetical protein